MGRKLLAAYQDRLRELDEFLEDEAGELPIAGASRSDLLVFFSERARAQPMPMITVHEGILHADWRLRAASTHDPDGYFAMQFLGNDHVRFAGFAHRGDVKIQTNGTLSTSELIAAWKPFRDLMYWSGINE